MATMNPFELLGDDDNGDLSHLIAVQQQKLAQAPKAPTQTAVQSAKQPPKLPSKHLPPSQAVREAKNETQCGGARGGGRGTSHRRGGRGFYRDSADNENAFTGNTGFSGGPEDGDAGKQPERRSYAGPRGGFRGGRRGGFGNGEAEEGDRPPRRVFERRSATGRGSEVKRDGAGRGNWGTPNEEVALEGEETVVESEKNVDTEKPLAEENAGAANNENPVNEQEEKEAEDKEMTLEEYQKVLEEKRKALLALKNEERKVDLDRELESMRLLSNKKNDDEIFIKLGAEKDKRKEAAEKEERAKKSVSINEFLKPADGENYYHGTHGRGRGRGRGGGFGGSNFMMNNVKVLSIEDVAQFPSLCAK